MAASGPPVTPTRFLRQTRLGDVDRQRLQCDTANGKKYHTVHSTRWEMALYSREGTGRSQPRFALSRERAASAAVALCLNECCLRDPGGSCWMPTGERNLVQ